MATPQETYDAMAAAGTAKIMMPWHKQMVQGFMAGAYVALGALFANLMEGKFTHYDGDEFEVAPGEANLIGGAVFPIGLIAIFMTGANLYTGNCMYIMPPLINGNVPRGRAVAWLIVSWLSNFAGAGFVAYFIAFQGEWTAKDPVKAYVMANATKKIDLKFAVAFLRGIGANWLVCLAWWQAISSKDTASKILSVRIVDVLIAFPALSGGSAASASLTTVSVAQVWWPVFAFTAIGFEHSIANMFYVDIGLLEGAPRTFGGFLLHNLLPVTLGNFVGGGVFLGLAQWATYDTTRDGYLPVGDVEAALGGQGASRALMGSLNAGGGGSLQGGGSVKAR